MGKKRVLITVIFICALSFLFAGCEMLGNRAIEYTVVAPNGEGFIFVRVEGAGNKINEGEDFRFMVLVKDTHKGTPSVKANNVSLTPENGIYTISNIREDQAITVTGLLSKETTTHTVTIVNSNMPGYQTDGLGQFGVRIKEGMTSISGVKALAAGTRLEVSWEVYLPYTAALWIDGQETSFSSGYIHTVSADTIIEVKTTISYSVSVDYEECLFSANLGYATPPSAITVTITNTGTVPTGVLSVSTSGLMIGNEYINVFTFSGSSSNYQIYIPSIAVGDTATFSIRPVHGSAFVWRSVKGLYTETIEILSSYTGHGYYTFYEFDASLMVAPTVLKPKAFVLGEKQLNYGELIAEVVRLVEADLGFHEPGLVSLVKLYLADVMAMNMEINRYTDRTGMIRLDIDGRELFGLGVLAEQPYELVGGGISFVNSAFMEHLRMVFVSQDDNILIRFGFGSTNIPLPLWRILFTEYGEDVHVADFEPITEVLAANGFAVVMMPV